MPLQTDYRPQSWRQLRGNSDVVKAIRSALKREDHNHCFLLTGGSGCGKTTTAYLIAKALKAYDPESNVNPNFRELNASDFKGIDMVRNVRRESATSPLSGDCRVYFFDECHKLTSDAQEAFLALLEKSSETPNYYIFATTNPESLKPTFKRRCAVYELKSPTDKEIGDLLFEVTQSENIDVPEEVIDQIVTDCTGSPGIALGILDAIMGLPVEEMLKAAKKTAAMQNNVIDLCRALASKKGWKEVSRVLSGLQGEDPESIRRKVLGYCSSWLLKQDNPRAFLILDAFAEPVYNTGFPGIVRACYIALNE